MRLQDKVAIITGGARGMGAATVRLFASEGARVVIAGRDSDKGAIAAVELSRHGEAHFIAANASDAESVAGLFHATLKLLGGLDVLYHVAGISGRRFGDGPLHECTDGGWQTTVAANLTSVFLTNRAALRHFLGEHQPGVILNMASVLAFSPSPQYFDTAAYTATKGGIVSLSRLAAARYARERIRVNVIAPALIETPMAARAAGDETIRAFLGSKQPLSGGPGAPQDCAGAAVFLCSDAANLITGIVLPVDGGWCVSDGQYPVQ